MKAFNNQWRIEKLPMHCQDVFFEVAAAARVMEGCQALLDGMRNSEETGKVFQFRMHGV
jgi:hypothetical protein